MVTHTALGNGGGCPKALHAPSTLSGRPELGRASISADPVGAEICFYLSGTNGFGNGSLSAHFVLGASDARTLVMILRSRGEGGTNSPSCDAANPSLVRLTYRTGVRTYTAAGCGPDVLSGPGGRRALSGIAALALGISNMDGPYAGATIRLPGYIGKSLPAAERALSAFSRRSRMQPDQLTVSQIQVDDPSVPDGQVIWQVPTPLSPEESDTAEMTFFVAEHPAPPCSSRQLAGRYTDGANGTGSHFGNFALFNTSGAPCMLQGQLSLTGVGRDGSPVTSIARERISSPIVLSARTKRATAATDRTSASIARSTFTGYARDDVPGGCMLTVPVRWIVRLSTGAHTSFSNGSTTPATALLRAAYTAKVPTGAFYSCGGSVSFDLTSGIGLG